MAAGGLKEEELLQGEKSGITMDIWQLAYCFLKGKDWKEREISTQEVIAKVWQMEEVARASWVLGLWRYRREGIPLGLAGI